MSRPRTNSPPLRDLPHSNTANWVADDEVNACYACHVEFGPMRRKHHCRQCGRVVCSDCSQHRIKIQGWPDKQRVCDDCHMRHGDDHTHALAEEARIYKTIQDALKKDLKDKASQITKFKTFLMSIDQTTGIEHSEDLDTMLLSGEAQIKEIRNTAREEQQRREKLSQDYDELRGKLQSKTEDAQKLAARVLRAESKVQELADDNIVKNELQEKLEKQEKEIAALRERLRATTVAENAHLADADSLVPEPSPRGARMTVIAQGRNEEEDSRLSRIGRCRDRCESASRCVVQ